MKSRMGAPLLLVTVLVFASSCATVRQPGAPVDEPVKMPRSEFPEGARVFSGHDGRSLDADYVAQRMARADIVMVGEVHNDAMGHFVEQYLVERWLTRFPVSAVAMEMFERDQQNLLDAYIAGEICMPGFYESVNAQRWAPLETWTLWYQPIVDSVRAREGSRLIAANASRRLVSVVRESGFEAIHALPDEERALVDAPVAEDIEGYRSRFFETMRAHGASHGGEGEGPADEQLEGYFRSQRIWDATMAASTVQAAREHGRSLLIAGGFHIDFDGGTVAEVRERAPELRRLTISIRPNNNDHLSDDDVGRADIVIYTIADERGEDDTTGTDEGV